MPQSPEEQTTHCLECGAALELREAFGRPRKTCPACGFILFQATATAAGAVIARGREVLLVRRSIEPGKGLWGFPAGFQDYGESLEETAVREVREETGLEISCRRVLAVTHSKANPRKFVNLIVYLAVAEGGELQPADDAMDARYFSLDDLPTDLAFENNRDILAGLQKSFPEQDIR